MSATVFITLLNDERVVRAIDSALSQGKALGRILVADGGSPRPSLERLRERYAAEPRVRIEDVPGNVAETRNRALKLLKEPLVAFLDADEVAPPGWLDALLKPLEEAAAFSGGPTRPLVEPTSRAERYVNRYDAWFYQTHVAKDIGYLPMGNSAWQVNLIRRLGGFDERLRWGGEDYDLNHRALQSGARGVFVPEAWVWHDQSHLDSWPKILRRQYRYNVGAAVAYLKNGVLRSRLGGAARSTGYPHWVQWAGLVVKPWALWQAHRYYRAHFR